MAEQCVCGKWFQSRAKLFGHGAHCPEYQRFKAWFDEQVLDDPGLTWSEAKQFWMDDEERLEEE